MENEVIIYEGSRAEIAQKRGNYEITSPLTGNSVTLKRDTDFGVIPRTKTPSLYKSGAEKVILSYGLLQHYNIESKVEQFGNDPFFFYAVRCDLVRVSSDGKEYVFASGLGSANTKEKRNGFNGAYDAANSSLKMAMKRAMVAAAINIGGLSSMFSQDIEDENFVEKGYANIANTQDPDAKLTAKQVKRLFAIAEDAGYNANECKNILAKNGITSTKDITQKEYDKVCELFIPKEG